MAKELMDKRMTEEELDKVAGGAGYSYMRKKKKGNYEIVTCSQELTVEQANKALKDAGLTPIYIEAELQSTVSNQSPAANTQVVRGSTVMLYSSGYSFFAEVEEETETVKVPKLIGKDRIDALDALKKVGLILDYDRTNCAGEVFEQDIPDGTEVPIGTVVHVQFQVKE